MRKQFFRVVLALGLLMLCPVIANAQYSSPNYKVSETFIGTGGELNACSTSYCSKQTAGEMAAGRTGSTNYSAQAGSNTDSTELFEVDVAGGNVDFGELSPTSTIAQSFSFSVRTYLAKGYIVKMIGNPPSNGEGGHMLDKIPAAADSVPGTEQFGLNLRTNTNPPIGVDPVQVPDNTFSFGSYSTGYDQVDKFQYNPGDTIAESPKSSGKTIFTVSMIANISTNTFGGKYTGVLAVLVIPTF